MTRIDLRHLIQTATHTDRFSTPHASHLPRKQTPSRLGFVLVMLPMFLALLVFPPPARAQMPPEEETAAQQDTAPQEPVQTEQTEPAAEDAAAQVPPSPGAGSPSEPAAESPAQPARPARVDPCSVRSPGKEQWIDQFRREIFETVCESAEWFDSFFGSRRFDEEAQRTHGRVGARLIWDEHEGVEFDGKFKIRVDFPNLDHRVNAFLGRDDEEEFLTGAEDNLDFLPTFFEREGDEDWLLGLGYTPVRGARSSLDFDAGVDAPLDPFVRAKYRQFWLLGDDNLLRLRQTLYWKNDRGTGAASRLDFERPTGSKTLTRLSGNFIYDEKTEGVDWDSGVTIYHGFSKDRAISWFVGVDGETDRSVPIEDYGTSFTYRQRMLRPWLFGEVITGVTWPRESLEEQREMAWHVGFGFELFFSGKDYQPRTRR